MLAGLLLLEWGWRAVRLCAFPLFSGIHGAVARRLRRCRHRIAEAARFDHCRKRVVRVGYPITRSGVTLTIGQYQLLVADACSGLHSMFSLSAMGLLYFYLIRHRSIARNLILIAAIPMMAFAANIVRVMALVLITYHFGKRCAAQGFIHSFAGILLFIVALLGLMALDSLLGLVFKDKKASQA